MRIFTHVSKVSSRQTGAFSRLWFCIVGVIYEAVVVVLKVVVIDEGGVVDEVLPSVLYKCVKLMDHF